MRPDYITNRVKTKSIQGSENRSSLRCVARQTGEVMLTLSDGRLLVFKRSCLRGIGRIWCENVLGNS